MGRTNMDRDIDTRLCESCEQEYECEEDSDAEYCDDCEDVIAANRDADRRYRRAESGYPDA
jgi:hypothetical protein